MLQSTIAQASTYIPMEERRGLPQFAMMMLDNLPNPTVLVKVYGPRRYSFCAVNKLGVNSFGINVAVGKYMEDVVPEGLLEPLYQLYQACVDHKNTIKYEQYFDMVESLKPLWLSISCIPILNEHNEVTYILSYGEDISAQKELERLQQEQQAARLAELSTPLLSISENTLVMPLIGSIDSYRINQLITTLLTGVSARHARTVILDITGVQVVDTQVADALIQSTQSLRLLGTQVFISGIRPEVAQTLVGLGVNLRSIQTFSTLQSAIAASLHN